LRQTVTTTRLTMDREGIRRLAAETLGLPTSPYRFCDSLAELQAAIDGQNGQAGVGYPCIVKPVMSSSGKGQSKLNGPADVKVAWEHAMAGGRVSHGRVIVEGFIDFDYEITLLTVRAKNAEGGIDTHFCEPVGHVQVNGDYVERWQPQPISATALRNPGASAVIYGGLDAKGVVFDGVDEALRVPGTDIRLFGKPESFVKRRMGVALAAHGDMAQARVNAKLAASKVKPRVA
jgi:phosphoribosylglycinamide formyltransferase 2